MKKKKYMFWILLVIFFGIFFFREQYMLGNLKDIRSGYRKQLGQLKIENAELKNERLMTKRKDYIENQARVKLGLVKPGEVLFVDKSKLTNK